MRDCDNQLIFINDRVAVQRLNYKELEVHIVIGFTDKRLKVYKEGDIKEKIRYVEPKRVAIVFRQKRED